MNHKCPYKKNEEIIYKDLVADSKALPLTIFVDFSGRYRMDFIYLNNKNGQNITYAVIHAYYSVRSGYRSNRTRARKQKIVT